jgi:hypothetical protein
MNLSVLTAMAMIGSVGLTSSIANESNSIESVIEEYNKGSHDSLWLNEKLDTIFLPAMADFYDNRPCLEIPSVKTYGPTTYCDVVTFLDMRAHIYWPVIGCSWEPGAAGALQVWCDCMPAIHTYYDAIMEDIRQQTCACYLHDPGEERDECIAWWYEHWLDQVNKARSDLSNCLCLSQI